MTSPLVTRLAQVALTVQDLPGALAFYRDRLGMRELFSTPAMAFLDCGGTRILLGTENASSQPTFLYFAVDDIQRAHEGLVAEGVAFESGPFVVARLEDRDVWLAAFRDPAGTLHHLLSEVKR